MPEDKRLHLTFIQGVITRMNTNSFQIKGLAIVVTTVLLGAYASSINVWYIYASIVPTIIFWVLDSYYLLLERKFRELYKDVSGINNSVTVLNIERYSMNINGYKAGKCSYWNVFLSFSITIIYIPLMLVPLAFFICAICK